MVSNGSSGSYTMSGSGLTAGEAPAALNLFQVGKALVCLRGKLLGPADKRSCPAVGGPVRHSLYAQNRVMASLPRHGR